MLQVLVCALALTVFAVSAAKELKYVQVITRHGARTPYMKFPTHAVEWNCTLHMHEVPVPDQANLNPVPRLYRKLFVRGKEILNGNCMQGELTDHGYNQHFALGQRFRTTYVESGFLPSHYNSEEIFIRSTDVPRTLKSAESQFLGMYPAKASTQDCSPEVLDIFTIENSVDPMIPPGANCPRLQQLCTNATETAQWHEHDEKYGKPLTAAFEKAWGDPASFPGLLSIGDIIAAIVAEQLPLPDGVTQSMVSDLNLYLGWTIRHLYNSDERATLAIGTFMEELLENLEQAVSESSPKWRLYSGHDVTLGWMLAALGAYGEQSNMFWPPFAANIEMLLYVDSESGVAFVQFMYMEQELKLPACNNSSICTLNAVKALFRHTIPTKPVSKLCQATGPAPPPSYYAKFMC